MIRFLPTSDVLFAKHIIAKYTDITMGISSEAERLFLQAEEAQEQQSNAVHNQIINYYQSYNQTLQTLITLNSCEQQNLLLQPCFQFISRFLTKNAQSLLTANTQTTIHNQNAVFNKNVRSVNSISPSYFLNPATTLLLDQSTNKIEQTDITEQKTVLQKSEKEIIKTVEKQLAGQLADIEKEKSISRVQTVNQRNEVSKLQQTVRTMHIDHIQQLLSNTILQGESLLGPYSAKQNSIIARQLKSQDYSKTAATLQAIYLSRINLDKTDSFNEQINKIYLQTTQTSLNNQMLDNQTVNKQIIQQNTQLHNTFLDTKNETINHSSLYQSDNNQAINKQIIQQNTQLHNTFLDTKNETINHSSLYQGNNNQAINKQIVQQNTQLHNTFLDTKNETINHSSLYQGNNNQAINKQIIQQNTQLHNTQLYNTQLHNTQLHNAHLHRMQAMSVNNKINNKLIKLTSYTSMANRFQTVRQSLQFGQQKQELLQTYSNAYINEENNRYTTNTSYIKHDNSYSSASMLPMLHKKEDNLAGITGTKLPVGNTPVQAFEEMPLLHRKESKQDSSSQTDFQTSNTQKNPDIEFITKTLSSDIHAHTTVTKNTAINELTNTINKQMHTTITGDALADLLKTDLALPDSKLQSVLKEQVASYQNVEKIAKQVYKAIENKLKTERTRRGL